MRTIVTSVKQEIKYVQQKIRKAKAEHISTQIAENRRNSKILWQQLKRLGY